MHNLIERFKRPIPPQKQYHDRLSREFELIEKFKFSCIFEKVDDIIKIADGIPHITRGSASCSLVSYLMGISEIDPIRDNISLARFMNDHRPDNPDIDLDFPYDRRDEIIEKIFDKWPKKVARISNRIHYRKDGAIREAMRRLGCKSKIPRKANVKDLMPGKEERVLELAECLMDQHSHFSLHCGGLVFFEDEVPRDLLIGRNQIYYDKNDVDELGILKIDLLCNRALAQLLDIDQRALSLYPDNDPKIAELFASGDVTGITFAESPTFRKAAKAVKPKNIQELAVALALIRPAAASRGRKKTFLDTWNEERKITQIVFEDDAIQQIQGLLGCSEDRADYYRRAFAKNNYKIIDEFKQKISHHPDVDIIISDLLQIKMYSFCKSHALSYAYLVWALAYQKVYNPHRFWKATLNHCKSMYRPWVYIQEAKKAGLKIDMGRPKWYLHEQSLKKPQYQMWLFEPDIKEQYDRFGSWFKDVIPNGLHFRREGDWLDFRGLVACHRKMKDMTFVTIGDGTGVYYDIILDKSIDMHGVDIVQGAGDIKHDGYNETIVVYGFRLEKV